MVLPLGVHTQHCIHVVRCPSARALRRELVAFGTCLIALLLALSVRCRPSGSPHPFPKDVPCSSFLDPLFPHHVLANAEWRCHGAAFLLHTLALVSCAPSSKYVVRGRAATEEKQQAAACVLAFRRVCVPPRWLAMHSHPRVCFSGRYGDDSNMGHEIACLGRGGAGSIDAQLAALTDRKFRSSSRWWTAPRLGQAVVTVLGSSTVRSPFQSSCG